MVSVRAFVPLSCAAVFSLSISCSSAKDDGDAACAPVSGDGATAGFADAASQARGLAFTVVDLQYTSSRLLYNDLATGNLSTVLTAESGDPALFAHGDRMVFFNRSNDRRNFKLLDPCSENFGPATEIATPQAGLGDPAALLTVQNDDVLVGHYDAGVLFVMDVASGMVRQQIDAAWDFDGAPKAQLRPVGLLAVDDTSIYVLHQGRNADDYQTLNGTQQVFVLKRGTDGQIVVEDRDAAKDGVQGIRLPLSNPARLVAGAAGKVVVAGQCTLWDADCTSGFVEIDVATGAVTMLFDTTDAVYKGNGGIVPGANGTFYALTVTGTADAVGDMAVSHLSPATQQATTLHTFPADSAGCCALYRDQSSGALWVGDRTKGGRGFLTIYKDTTVAGTFQLDAIPYSGLFLD